MFDALYPEATDTALEAQARRAPTAPEVPWFKNGWSAVGKAIPRAGAEMGRAMTSLVTPEAMGGMDAPTMFSAPGKTSKPQLAQEIREQDRAIRDAIKEFTPDPNSTGAASMILHDVTRFVGKAVTYGALGGTPGAIAGMGLDEGYNEAAKRMDEGVDPATAAKLGAVHGLSSAVAVALPVAGKTVAQTIGLAAAGGPGSYIAEQMTAREILENADYTKEAAEIDPFDPLGLGVAFFGSVLFGGAAHAVRGVKARAEAKAADAQAMAAPEPPGKPTEVAQAVARAYTPEQVDAAHVAVLQHQRESVALHAVDDLPARTEHAAALDRASEQLATGQRVSVADMAPVDAARMLEEAAVLRQRTEAIPHQMEVAAHGARAEDPALQRLEPGARDQLLQMYETAGREKPAFDSTLTDIARDIGGEAKLPELKGIDRAVEKVAADYGGNPIQMKDLLRGTIIANSVEDAQIALASLGDRVQILERGQRNLLVEGVIPGADGYRDAKVNVLINGHVAEVQVNLPQMLAAKKIAHPLYAKATKLEREYEGKVMPPEVREQVTGLLGQQRAIYDAAWTEAMSARKSSSETGVPLRRADSEENTLGGSVSQAMENGMPGAPGSSDTGMPSTSRNSPLGPNLGNAIKTSDAPILPEQAAAHATARQAAEIAQSDPNMMVMMEGMDQPVPAHELLAEAKAMMEQEMADAPLLQVAAECALRG